MREITRRVQGNDGRMDLPTLTISAGNGWMNQIDRFSGNIAGKEQKNYTLLKKGQLSYNHGNSKLAKYGAVFELRDYQEALVPRVYHSFETIRGDAGFIDYMFSMKLPDRELRKLVSSGARMDGLLNINYDDFSNIVINTPSLVEQKKIRTLLEVLDSLITAQERKVDLLRKKKTYYLQQIFSQKLRFKGFSAPWEQRKLGELIIKGGSGGTPKTENDDYYGGDVPFLSISDIPKSDGTVYATARSLTTHGLMQSAAWIVPEGSIALAMYASVGRIAILGMPAATSQAFFNMVFETDTLRDFVFYSLQLIKLTHGWERVISTGTQPNLNAAKVKATRIQTPSEQEQSCLTMKWTGFCSRCFVGFWGD